MSIYPHYIGFLFTAEELLEDKWRARKIFFVSIDSYDVLRVSFNSAAPTLPVVFCSFVTEQNSIVHCC
jgi:hypothetical protein